MKIAVLNKTDKAGKDSVMNVEREFVSSGVFERIVKLSAKTGEGVDTLRAEIESLYAGGEINLDTEAVLLNARQNSAAEKALRCVERAVSGMKSGMSADMIDFELEEALSELGELDGRRVSEEIVNDIFHHFCVGK